MYDLIGIKANTSFRAGYKGLAGDIYVADLLDPAAPRIERLRFVNMREEVFPFEDVSEFAPRAFQLGSSEGVVGECKV